MDEGKRNRIIYSWHSGQSQREIARKLHVSRNTISAVIRAYQAQRRGEPQPEPLRRRSGRTSGVVEPFLAEIKLLLARYPYIRITELHRRLQAKGFAGSYTTLRERVNRLRSRSRPGVTILPDAATATIAEVTVRRLALATGGGELRPVYIFQYRLSPSGWTYHHLMPRSDLAALLHEHTNAFAELEGVAPIARYFRVDAICEGGQRNPPVPKETFLRFASHYGFCPQVLAEPWIPTNEATDPLTAIVDFLSAENGFRTLDAANSAMAEWKKRHQSGAMDAPLPSREREKLIPLPAVFWPG